MWQIYKSIKLFLFYKWRLFYKGLLRRQEQSLKIGFWNCTHHEKKIKSIQSIQIQKTLAKPSGKLFGYDESKVLHIPD